MLCPTSNRRFVPEAVIDWVSEPQFSRRQRSQHIIGFRAWAKSR